MEDFRTESEKLADQLRTCILNGEFKGGSKLPQRAIAEQFNTTTTVVREAFRSVENEGLVKIVPRYGAIVDEVTPEKLKGRYIVREALEGMAARVASFNVSAMNRDQLLMLADRCDAMLPFENFTDQEKAVEHLALHNYIAQMTCCDELIRSLRNIYLRTMLLSNAVRVEWSSDTLGWHRQLADAILSGDPDEAERMMRIHVQRGYAMELQALLGADRTE